MTGTTNPSTGRTDQFRVLVVEDDADLRETLIAMLEVTGYSAVAAHDGAAALALAEREQPDVALVDIGLPDMTGYELARRLRTEAGGRRIRLVALSGLASSEDRRLALAAGFDEHAAKPLDLSQIAQLVGRGMEHEHS